MHGTMRTLFASAAALLSILALAACGSSGGGTASADSSGARDTARLKLQECLRQQGIDAPAPGATTGQPRQVSGADRQKFQTAVQGPCKKYAQNAFGNLSDAQRQDLQDQFAKFATCMRQHGVDLPNVTPGQGPPAGVQRLNRNTPKFQAAAKACEKLRPQRPGGGGPGGPPGG